MRWCVSFEPLADVLLLTYVPHPIISFVFFSTPHPSGPKNPEKSWREKKDGRKVLGLCIEHLDQRKARNLQPSRTERAASCTQALQSVTSYLLRVVHSRTQKSLNTTAKPIVYCIFQHALLIQTSHVFCDDTYKPLHVFFCTPCVLYSTSSHRSPSVS